MIRTRLFRRHFAITAFVMILSIGLGFLISNAIIKFALNRPSFQQGPEPAVFFSRLIDHFDSHDRLQALKTLEKISGVKLPIRLVILDENGKNISGNEIISIPWDKVPKPKEPYKFVPFDQDHRVGGPPNEGLILFPGLPTQYLYHIRPNHPGGPRGGPPASIFFATFGSLVFSILLGIGFALFILFRSMHEKMKLVDSVITELQKGNLKARFPIQRMDEMGEAMNRFNKMADEIERLVDQLRNVEKSRMTLLQDLTHDLRTPIASLKNLLATVEKKSESKDQTLRSELLSLAQREVDYFERLVEDLLMLAQVSEPRYQANQEIVSIQEILEEESESISVQDDPSGKKLSLQVQGDQKSYQVHGDAHLLRRLFRNALENAYYFSKSEVSITIQASSDQDWVVSIQDDGPGLSEAALKGFGERRVSRTIERTKGYKLSVGLGSVIMKTVAELHRGKVIAKNHLTPSGESTGAEILIVLPRAI